MPISLRIRRRRQAAQVCSPRSHLSQKADTIRRATKGDEKPKEDGIKTQVIEAVTVTAERPRVKISTLR